MVWEHVLYNVNLKGLEAWNIFYVGECSTAPRKAFLAVKGSKSHMGPLPDQLTYGRFFRSKLNNPSWKGLFRFCLLCPIPSHHGPVAESLLSFLSVPTAFPRSLWPWLCPWSSHPTHSPSQALQLFSTQTLFSLRFSGFPPNPPPIKISLSSASCTMQKAQETESHFSTSEVHPSIFDQISFWPPALGPEPWKTSSVVLLEYLNNMPLTIWVIAKSAPGIS